MCAGRLFTAHRGRGSGLPESGLLAPWPPRSVTKGNLSECPLPVGGGASPSGHRLPIRTSFCHVTERQAMLGTQPFSPAGSLPLLCANSPGGPCPPPPPAVALFPGSWCRAPLVADLPRTSQPQLVCLQTLLSKYNQQYHKLFKDIPLEEVVLKGELSPRCGWTGA